MKLRPSSNRPGVGVNHSEVTPFFVYSGFMSEHQKAEFERNRFLRAAAIAGIEVVADSVASRPPPEPDILCTLTSGEIVAFELVELVDPDEPRTLSRAVKTGSIEVFGIDTTKPTRGSLRRKLVENLYRSQHPMELIAFGGDTLGPRNVWVPTHDNNLIQDWLDQSAFRRLRVVCLGRREPGVWLDRVREP
jgi:hypothetical protein